MRVRIEYTKGEEVRFLGHLEIARAWERALRRAGLPLAFSQGFNPRPKISFGPALAVGVTGKREYLDLCLAHRLLLRELKALLSPQLPPGISLRRLKEISPEAKSLTASINS